MHKVSPRWRRRSLPGQALQILLGRHRAQRGSVPAPVWHRSRLRERFGSQFVDSSTRRTAAGEGDFGDFRVRDLWLPCYRAVSRYDVYNTWRQPRFRNNKLHKLALFGHENNDSTTVPSFNNRRLLDFKS
jgi:hypothetical protein